MKVYESAQQDVAKKLGDAKFEDVVQVLMAARLYVQVDGPDRTWQERKFNHEKLGRALEKMGVRP